MHYDVIFTADIPEIHFYNLLTKTVADGHLVANESKSVSQNNVVLMMKSVEVSKTNKGSREHRSTSIAQSTTCHDSKIMNLNTHI